MKKQFLFFLISIVLFGLLTIPKITIAASFPSEPSIESISPLDGAVGDQVRIKLPIDYHYYCSADGTWAHFELSANVYFNNVQATTNQLIGSYTKGNTPPTWYPNGAGIISAKVPASATTGKIKVELICSGSYYHDEYVSMQGIKSIYEEVSYNATLYSPTNFTVLSPAAQDDFSVRQQYLQQTKVDQAWNYTHGSSDVVVAVIDDGVYIGHPDLDKNMWINSDEIEGNGKDDDNNGYVDDKWGWDFVSNSKDMTTAGTHGTMVAGIIGAIGNNNTGITGINWNVKLMPIIACDNMGCDSLAIKRSIMYAVKNGADIINISLGGRIFDYTDNFNEIIKYAFDRNILVVIAAGNGDLEGGIGRNLSITKVSPVCNDGNENMVLGVGAVDANNYLTSWSNYGGCVDAYAPGVDIISTAVPAYSTLGGFYDVESGTSFSAPIVTGIAALIKTQYPAIKNSAIMDRIINNLDSGVVNAYKAISQPFTDSEKVTNSAGISAPNTSEPTTEIDINLSNKLKGKILLQVENHGEAYYVNPKDNKKYYMADGNKAYGIMRNLGVGITNKNLEKIKTNKTFAKNNGGKIFLQVESHGEAYYIDFNGTAHYLKDGAAAYGIMRSLGLGITNNDLNKIPEGSL